ncbi:hypothetical protein KC678_02470, partial [Candidatus Dojkabacteria bacterium]|nr:hypothetical protein [Candidatus Dojkabacteria bacterium]
MENVKTHPKDDALFRRSSFVSRLLRLDDISRKEMMLVGLLLALILSILFILTNLGLIYRILNIEAGTRTVNFSGKIVNKADGTNLISGTPACVNGGADTCDFRVRIYDASSGGNLLFEEEHANVELGDTDGVFSLDINSICNSAASGSSDWGTTACVSNGGVDFSSSSLFLELAFAPGGAGSYIEVFARKQLSNTGSAFYAERAGTLDTGFTSGSIVFEGSSGISEDNSNLFWDNASKYLGVGVNDPGYEIDVDGDIYLRSQGIDNKSGQISFQATTTAAGDRTGYIRQDGTDGINSLLQIGTSGYIGFVLDSNIVSILHNNGLTIGTTTVGANTLSLYQDTDNEAILVQAPNLINKPSFSLQNLPLSTDLNTGKAFEIKVTGESFGRVQFYSDGAYGIGPGSATRDVFLSRAAANRFLISANKVSSSADLTITRALRVGSTSAPFAYLDTAGGTASLASIRVRAGVATAAPTAGDIYSDGTDLFFYNGSGWDDLTATGSLWIDYGTFINYGANPVSIGTASTSGELLTINNAANDTYLRVQNTSTGATSADGGSLGYASASSVLELWNLENAGLSFGTNGTERLTISASGVLTASNLAGGGNQCVQVDNSGILSGSGSVCGGTSYWTQSGSNIYYNTGNISVGTTASQAKIHAQTSASANMLMFENTGGTADKRAFGFYNYYGGTSSSNLLVLRAYNNSYSVVRDLMTFNHDGAVSMQG